MCTMLVSVKVSSLTIFKSQLPVTEIKITCTSTFYFMDYEYCAHVNVSLNRAMGVKSSCIEGSAVVTGLDGLSSPVSEQTG